MEGLVFIHEKPMRTGRNAARGNVTGAIKKTEPGKFILSCSMAKDVAEIFSAKDKGFLLGIKDSEAYLGYVKNGYKLSNYGKGTSRKAFSAVLHETPENKMFFKAFSGKTFSGQLVDMETIKLVFQEDE